MSYVRRFLVGLSIFLLVGCGGGGDSNPTAPTSPAAPTGITAAAGAGSVILSWNPVSGTASYNVYMATAPGVTKANHASLPGGMKHTGAVSPMTHSGLTNGVTYYFVVTAVGTGGESSESAEVAATPVATGSTSPVTGDATSITESSAQLVGSFTNPSGYVTTAQFEYGTTITLGSSTAPTSYAAVGPISVSATLSGLAGGATHYYRLRTENSDGVFTGAVKTFTTFATPQVLASGLNEPLSLHLQGGDAYWVEIYGDVVRKVPTSGGAVSVVGTSAMGGNNASLALDATDLYWADDQTIWKVSLTGGPVTTLVTGQSTISALRRHASELYWREYWDGVGASFGGIMKMSTAGGTVDTLVTVITPDGIPFVGSLVVDGTGIYWTDRWGGTINWRALGGGPTVVLALGLTGPDNLIHDGGMLYWTEASSVRKMPETGGAITTITTGDMGASGLAKDATHVYWVDGGSQIKKADLSTGVAVTLAVGQVNGCCNNASDVAVDGSSVFWIVGGNQYYPPLGSVRKIPK